MILFNNVQILSEDDHYIDFSLDSQDIIFHVNIDQLITGKPSVIGDISEQDQVLFKKEFSNQKLIIYIKDNELIASLSVHGSNFLIGNTSFAINCESYDDGLVIKQTGETSVSLSTPTGQLLIELDDIAAYESAKHLVPVDFNMNTIDYRYLVVGKIEYKQFNTFLLYDLFRKELNIKNIRFNVLANNAGLKIRLSGPDLLEVAAENDVTTMEFKRITGKSKKIFDFYELEDHRNKHMLTSFMINDVRYYIHNKQSGVFITKGNASKVSGFEANLHAFYSKNHLYIYGRNTHYAFNAGADYDYLYIKDNEKPTTKFIRPINFRFFRRFGIFKIPVSAINTDQEQQRGLYLGDQQMPLHPLKLKMNQKKAKLVTLKKTRYRVDVLATSKRGNASFVSSHNPEDYTLKKRTRNWFNKLKTSKKAMQLFKFLFIVIGRLPKKQKLVVFESFHAKQYSDSPRAIYEYMKEHHPDYELLWSVDKQAETLFKDFGVPFIRRFTLSWFLQFPRAKYWVNNVRLPAWMPKPKDTKYIQTWHGTPLKKLGIDIEEIHMPGTSTSTYKKNFVTEAKKWDYLVSPNAYSSDIFSRAFHYSGNVIESGYPRNDLLSNHSEKLANEIKQKLGIPEDKKIMLYAPTWRDNEFYEKGKYKFEFQFNLNNWKKEFGEEWVLVSRMHYLVAENFDFSAHEGTVYDASSYPDIRDLYLISDLMITDYSSVFFDYAILNRPIVFFMYDLEQYRDQLRGFYIDIEEEAPGPIVETENELFKAINDLKDSDVNLNPKFSVFKNKFSSLEDGEATERVVNAFLE